MGALTIRDLNVIEGEGRVSDRRITEALGYARTHRVRRIVRENMAELETYGEVFTRIVRKPPKGSVGGRPETGFLLNEAQALLICMFSRTERAAEVRRQLIEVFMAWRRGQLHPGRPENPFSGHRERVEDALACIRALREMGNPAIDLAHLPVWRNGRRPNFWADIEVREFLTATHRQMPMKDVRLACRAKFGASRTPSSSALCRYWQLLDRVRGADRPSRAHRTKTLSPRGKRILTPAHPQPDREAS